VIYFTKLFIKFPWYDKKMKSYVVYIVACSDKTLYVGITVDLQRRLQQHNGIIKGGAKYTRNKRPVVLVYSEMCENRSLATKREFALKKLSREEKKILCNI
jgi:putative endonuclease